MPVHNTRQPSTAKPVPLYLFKSFFRDSITNVFLRFPALVYELPRNGVLLYSSRMPTLPDRRNSSISKSYFLPRRSLRWKGSVTVTAMGAETSHSGVGTVPECRFGRDQPCKNGRSS